MRHRMLVPGLVSVLLLTGCGGSADEPDAEETTPAGTTTATQDPGSSGEATVLLASVGTEEDPEAFVIALTDESGEPVTTLPAGDYVIQVSDPSTSHNFRLRGEGVDESTSVPGTDDATFEVTLDPGDYTYTCDPHPAMTGTFTVE
ncbi:cupredoxin domain-containing protein [Actinotalea sp. K2]|uniref:cupredoxin domain-containing protein n=1 Tax=Actinotalea sp. K2 TaxID=2939438 RepID=UPI002016DD1A|nr:cupredoxin domain-containing protein [Actinotalea sp. K2]MCL3859651.1 cupredoxin domain-containing protein [Actinotalea sp. K2]